MISFVNDSGVIEVTDTSVSPPIIERWLKDMLRIEQYVDIIRFTGTLEDAPGRKEYQLADEATAIAERQTLYEYLEDYGGGGGGGGVQSVTGLDTDNTDPANPVIQIAVDGVTITGDGTPGNPLAGASSFALEILEDGVSVDANVDEINFITPLKATQTAAGKVDVELDGNAILTGAMYELQQELNNRNSFGTCYVASENKYFITNQTTGNVRVFDATTFELLATISVSAAIEPDYISYSNEVWTSNLSTGVITRIDATTNAIIGTITPPATNTALRQFIEYLNPLSGNPRVYTFSSTTSNLLIYDLVANTFSTVALGGSRLCLNGVIIDNVASAMHRHLLIAGTISTNTGIRIFDCEAGTFAALDVVPPTMLASDRPYYIDYNPTRDELAISYPESSVITIIKPLTATTFTTEGKIFCPSPLRVRYDIANQLLLATLIYNLSNNTILTKYSAVNYLPLSSLQTSMQGTPNQTSSIHILGNGVCIAHSRHGTLDAKTFTKIKYV